MKKLEFLLLFKTLGRVPEPVTSFLRNRASFLRNRASFLSFLRNHFKAISFFSHRSVTRYWILGRFLKKKRYIGEVRGINVAIWHSLRDNTKVRTNGITMHLFAIMQILIENHWKVRKCKLLTALPLYKEFYFQGSTL